MTTPNQPAPDGAFVIGGDDHYGQDYNEEIVRALFAPPVPNVGNSLELLRQQLMKLPLEALQFFKDLIPGWVQGTFDTVSGAVTWIMTNLGGSIVAGIQRILNQILEIFNGLVVTPINAALQGLKDWWATVTGQAGESANPNKGLEVYRASTSNGLLTGSGDVVCPAHFLDGTDAASDYVIWSAATSSAEVTKEAFYDVNFRLEATNDFAPGESFEAIIYVNGFVKKRGVRWINETGATVSEDRSAAVSVSLSLQPGDVVSPGKGGTASLTCPGDPNGTLTYFSVVAR